LYRQAYPAYPAQVKIYIRNYEDALEKGAVCDQASFALGMATTIADLSLSDVLESGAGM